MHPLRPKRTHPFEYPPRWWKGSANDHKGGEDSYIGELAGETLENDNLGVQQVALVRTLPRRPGEVVQPAVSFSRRLEPGLFYVDGRQNVNQHSLFPERETCG